MPWIYEYKLNKYGFRSMDFIENPDILTLGCSHTFGVGMPEDFIWPNLVYRKTEAKSIANLALSGASVTNQIRNLGIYIQKYGTPKIVLCNFPDLYRYETISKDKKIVFGSTKAPYQHYKYSDSFAIYENIKNLLLLESICKSNKIKLLWSTWHNDGWYQVGEEYFIDNFKNYLPFQRNECLDPENKKFMTKSCGAYTEEVEDFYECAYDRYDVPKKYIDKKLEKNTIENLINKTKKNNLLMTSHKGAHHHWHWAEYYIRNI